MAYFAIFLPFKAIFRIDKILFGLSVGRSVGLLIEIQSIEVTGLKLGGLWSEGMQNEIWAKKVLIKGVKTP